MRLATLGTTTKQQISVAGSATSNPSFAAPHTSGLMRRTRSTRAVAATVDGLTLAISAADPPKWDLTVMSPGGVQPRSSIPG
eukprot:3757904-Prymnesium_polylepis.1